MALLHRHCLRIGFGFLPVNEIAGVGIFHWVVKHIQTPVVVLKFTRGIQHLAGAVKVGYCRIPAFSGKNTSGQQNDKNKLYLGIKIGKQTPISYRVMNIQAEKKMIIEQFKQVTDVNLIHAIKNMLDYAMKKEQENLEVHEAHQKLVMERFEKIRKNPDKLLDWDEAKKNAERLMKRYKIKIEPEALTDIQEITDWYNELQNGLGGRFQKTAVRHINSLKKDPQIYAVRYNEIRCDY